MEKSGSKKQQQKGKASTTQPKDAPATQPVPIPPIGYKISMNDFRELLQLIGSIGIDKYRQQAIFTCINDKFEAIEPEQ